VTCNTNDPTPFHESISQDYRFLSSQATLLLYGALKMARHMVERPNGKMQRVNMQSIEERNFNAALAMVESHFTRRPPLGPKTFAKTLETVRRTMDKTLNKSEIRYC
jgi:hypothetical protein